MPGSEVRWPSEVGSHGSTGRKSGPVVTQVWLCPDSQGGLEQPAILRSPSTPTRQGQEHVVTGGCNEAVTQPHMSTVLLLWPGHVSMRRGVSPPGGQGPLPLPLPGRRGSRVFLQTPHSSTSNMTLSSSERPRVPRARVLGPSGWRVGQTPSPTRSPAAGGGTPGWRLQDHPVHDAHGEVLW